MDEDYFPGDAAAAAAGADAVVFTCDRSGSLSVHRAAGHGGGKFFYRFYTERGAGIYEDAGGQVLLLDTTFGHSG